MTLKKCDSWPLVAPGDDGIRPAGRPDECFYCQRRVGELHGSNCVCVNKIVEYSVFAHGRPVGTFRRADPHSWTVHDCEFHKNRSSWCSDSALDEMVWSDPFVEEEAAKLAIDSCCCGFLEFRFERVIDDGPFVEVV